MPAPAAVNANYAVETSDGRRKKRIRSLATQHSREKESRTGETTRFLICFLESYIMKIT